MVNREQHEFWRWSESNWTSALTENRHGSLVTAGVDIGSTSTQAVIMVDSEIFAYSSIRTGNNSPDSAIRALLHAMENTDLSTDDIDYCVGTGYGRVNVPFADRTVTEISCHARGGNYIYGPTVRTILDMGGQDCKAIHCDESGKVTSFSMNEKCAAGTGRGMEVLATLLALHVEDIGEASFDIDEEPEPVNSICVVFAKTEATNLMRQGWTKEKVLASYCRAMAIRVVGLLEKNGLEEDFAITGGIAKNIGVVKRIESLLGIEALKPSWDTQLAGAIGAAIIARDSYERIITSKG